MERRRVIIEINGRRDEREIDPRLLLSDFNHHEAGLTGTHYGTAVAALKGHESRCGRFTLSRFSGK